MNETEKKKYQLGDYIDIYCKRCRLNLDGSVAVLEDGEVVKVMCRTCFTYQPYKLPVDMQEKKRKQLEKILKMRDKKIKSMKEQENMILESIKKGAKLGTLWEQLMQEYDFRKAKPYDQHRTYQLKDFILHKSYGVGIVVNIFDDQNIQTLFRDNIRNLPYNQSQENE